MKNVKIKRRINRNKILIFLIILFVILRILFILKGEMIFHKEEPKVGSMASDLYFFGKFKLPFFMYLDSPHSGGGLIMSLFLIPIFMMIGPRIISLKILGLIISTIWFFILIKIFLKIFEFNSKKPNINYFTKKNFYIPFLIIPLFLISSPHLLFISTMVIGNTNLFILMIVLSLFFLVNYKKMHFYKFLFFFGILNGIALYSNYSYNSILFANLLFLIGIIIKRKGKHGKFCDDIKSLFLFLIGFLIGFTPFIIYNILYKFPSIFADLFFNMLSSVPFYLYSMFERFIGTTTSLIQSFHFREIFCLSSEFQSYLIFFIMVLTIIVSEIIRVKYKHFFNCDKNNLLDSCLFVVRLYFVTSFLVVSFSNIPLRIYGFDSLSIYAHRYVLHLQLLLILYFYFSFISIYEMIIIRFKKQIKIFNIYKFLIFVIITLIFSLNFWYTINNNEPNKFIFPIERFDSKLNAFESGFNFVSNEEIFILGLNKLRENDYKQDYIKGAVYGLIVINDENRFYKIFNILNDYEKKLFIKSYGDFMIECTYDDICNILKENSPKFELIYDKLEITNFD